MSSVMYVVCLYLHSCTRLQFNVNQSVYIASSQLQHGVTFNKLRIKRIMHA